MGLEYTAVDLNAGKATLRDTESPSFPSLSADNPEWLHLSRRHWPEFRRVLRQTSVNSQGCGETRDSVLVRWNFFRNIFQRIDIILGVWIGEENNAEHHEPQSDEQPEHKIPESEFVEGGCRNVQDGSIFCRASDSASSWKYLNLRE